MSREISAEKVKIEVAHRLANLSGGYNAEDIRTIMHDISNAIVNMAEADIARIAEDAVRADYVATTRLMLDQGCLTASSTLMHSASSIKTVREATGCDLPTARNAVAIATSELYRHLADLALTNLAKTNERCPSYATRSYVESIGHPHVIRVPYNRPDDEIPF